MAVRMLRAVWHAMGNLVHGPCQGCLSLGHHPKKPFREAGVLMIAKSGRRDLSTPRAWRHTSILSCLGKGLERLIARRLSNQAAAYRPTAPELPKACFAAAEVCARIVYSLAERIERRDRDEVPMLA
ncbi:hypothetical protein HIM_09119 [Hirsutella minnesotensis 3608]|uniref:Reverse transcriptase domain-containing protein n=1 Tax=Hirsutella minnesotensis 3608 TaxID=1043627 RepID=A0A0F7ZLU7_9HYPO|nr:hypothetical protein HIM_09119 [Hirsutella minnesotensis 3608]